MMRMRVETARWVEGTFRSFGAWHNVRKEHVFARGRCVVEVGRVVLPASSRYDLHGLHA